ncbi:MAG: SDR family oxidoreductase [Candidatus Heimdallarchaeota archaeon]|nr:SDR family oxidoreductase [Candidatus Heimdallarchaeota archaeon]
MNKIIVITGASSGIGLSHAVYLTYKGYTVFGTNRSGVVKNLNDLKDIYLQNHTKYHFTNRQKTKVKPGKYLVPKTILDNLDELLRKISFFKMDVTSEDSVQTAIQEMEAKAKQLNGRGIDVLINNAGISFFKSSEDLSIEDWQKTFEVNLFGVIRVVKAILPFMRARKAGQIINTSSLGAIAAIPFQAHYSASKIATKVFTEGLRVEVKPFNIKVSAILPSDINTNFNINMFDYSNIKENNISLHDILHMMENTPTDRNSPYYNSAQKVWKVIVKNLIMAPPPIVVSKDIYKIIKSRRPKVNYNSGSLSQIFLTYLIRRIVSDEFTYSLLPKYFGL